MAYLVVSARWFHCFLCFFQQIHGCTILGLVIYPIGSYLSTYINIYINMYIYYTHI